uniref:ADF-H domain-containing protein n=1 Tax=Eptatretus burgeri TaxID=7764 RepID=A0A8C4QFP8_EPTBU
MVQKLNPQLCAALPAHHTLTGCDSNHSLSGIDKRKSFGILSSNPEHEKGLAKLGQKPDMNKLTNADCEKFVCSLLFSELQFVSLTFNTFVLYSYKYKHDDGRCSFPLCFIFISPQGCKPDLQMMYAGTKNNLVRSAQLTKVSFHWQLK